METFAGTPFDVGYQLGKALAPGIHRAVEDCYVSPPPISAVGVPLLTAIRLTDLRYPHVAKELRGIAAGAQVRLFDLMFAFYEELWDSEESEGGCTDIVAEGRATRNGRTLLGHNNDEEVEPPNPVLLRLAPVGGPVVTGISLDGRGFSVGVNSFGLVLSGNQVTARDLQAGIPRLVLVRAALSQPTLVAAAAVLGDPLRSSSYNNILADATGQVLCLEGSGQHLRQLRPTPSGILTHSNHFLHPDMQLVEGKKDLSSTVLREQRSCTLMEAQAGQHTLSTLAAVLRDHQGYPDSICRHSSDVVTNFSVLFEPERRRFWYQFGHPCEGTYQVQGY